MIIIPAYYTGTHHYSFRTGQRALIVGVFMVQPSETEPPRACFKVVYPDGRNDFCPVEDYKHYKIDR